MTKINLLQKTLGVNFIAPDEANVLLWAPPAKTAALVLADQKTIPLNREEYGYWKLSTKELMPGDSYQFLLDGNKLLPDPASLSQPGGVHGPSSAFDVKDFKWTDEHWENPALEKYLIYEIHTGTFSFEGSFAAIEQKLDHLIALGVTAIEIMPVGQFAGGRNWGYDGVFPFAVQNSYGGPLGLMQLVNTCHQKNIAVILDVVYNHIGPEGNYLPEFAPYFTDKYKTPWGNAINFDDEWCDQVRQYYIENALMWFRDFHIDALRLDAVHAIKDFSPVHILREIKENADQLMELTGKKHYMMVELDLNDTRFINPLKEEGFGMDSQWIDEFHHALRVTAGGDRNGYYADFTGIGQLAKSYRDAYVFDGIYSAHRKKTFGIKAEDNPGRQFIVFSQNHDQVGNRMLGERSSRLFNFEMQKLLAGAVMVSPFIPLLFMGEEWSAQSPFLYFVSHTDPELIEAVRKGRKQEFTAFHTEGEAPDPVAEDTYNRSKLPWNSIDEDGSQKMLNYYKKLIALRKELPALHCLERKQLETTVNEDKQTLLLHRWFDKQHVCCVMNFSGEQRKITLPVNYEWKKVLDSADEEFNGPGQLEESRQPLTMFLQPQSLIIYTNFHV